MRKTLLRRHRCPSKATSKTALVKIQGICIEDVIGGWDDVYEFDASVERITAAVSAARALPHDFMLTARADGIMIGNYDTDEAIKRVQAYAAVGADCVYAPLPPTMDDLARLIASVDVPVNVLVTGQFAKHTTADFAAIGAARLSVGSSFARTTHALMYETGGAMIGGDFTALGKAMPFKDMDDFLK